MLFHLLLPITGMLLATVWACQAGKHVYAEKPACHNIFEGRKMVEAAVNMMFVCRWDFRHVHTKISMKLLNFCMTEVLVMFIWQGVSVTNHAIPLVLQKTVLRLQHFITINGWDLLSGVNIMRKEVITTGTGIGIPETETVETREFMNSILPAGVLISMNILSRFILPEVYMELILKSVRRKLQIHNPLCLNTRMEQCWNSKQEDDISTGKETMGVAIGNIFLRDRRIS